MAGWLGLGDDCGVDDGEGPVLGMGGGTMLVVGSGGRLVEAGERVGSRLPEGSGERVGVGDGGALDGGPPLEGGGPPVEGGGTEPVGDGEGLPAQAASNTATRRAANAPHTGRFMAVWTAPRWSGFRPGWTPGRRYTAPR